MARTGISARGLGGGGMSELSADLQGWRPCIGWARVAEKVVRCKWNALNYGGGCDWL